MVNYQCANCLKEFNKKSNYTSHLNRKYSCKKVEITSLKYSKDGISIPKEEYIEINNTCNYCNRTYSTISNLNKHLKNCKEKDKEELKEELLSLLIKEQDKIKDEQNLYLKHKIELLQGELKIKNKTINSHNNINSNNNNQTINILAYNKTDMSHITDKDFERIMRRCNMCIPRLIEKTHYDPGKPENKNIFISNLRDKYVMSWNGKRWDVKNRDEALDDMFDNGACVLEDKIETWEENKYQYDPIAVSKFYKFLDNKEKDEVQNKIKEEIKLILYNNRNKEVMKKLQV